MCLMQLSRGQELLLIVRLSRSLLQSLLLSHVLRFRFSSEHPTQHSETGRKNFCAEQAKGLLNFVCELHLSME